MTLERQHEVYESNVADQHQRILNRTKEDFLTEMKARVSHRSSEIIELLVQARFKTRMHSFEILKPPNPDYIQLVKSFDVSTLLIMGDIGSVISHDMAIELSNLNPCLKAIQIKEAGHGVPYDQPEHFSEVVQTFFLRSDSL